MGVGVGVKGIGVKQTVVVSIDLFIPTRPPDTCDTFSQERKLIEIKFSLARSIILLILMFCQVNRC